MNELGLEIKVDKVYVRVFFTEAKKRYVGILKDGRVDIVGFEAVRGDWTEIAKDVQEKVAQLVLSTGRTDEAIEHVRKTISDLKTGKIPLEKLIIWKTLTRKLSEYAVEAPHIAAARRLQKAGIRVDVGSKVGYVIAKGSGKLSSRAIPYMMIKPEDIDYEYYIRHQIIPAALRILSYFGVTEKQLVGAGSAEKTLFHFVKKKSS